MMTLSTPAMNVKTQIMAFKKEIFPIGCQDQKIWLQVSIFLKHQNFELKRKYFGDFLSGYCVIFVLEDREGVRDDIGPIRVNLKIHPSSIFLTLTSNILKLLGLTAEEVHVIKGKQSSAKFLDFHDF